MNILHIEDNPGDIYLVRFILGKMDFLHNIINITNGQSALNYLQVLKTKGPASFPDLIILDLNLPGISGFDVLTEIRKDILLNEIPVVVLAAYSPDMYKCLGTGAMACYEKHLDIDKQEEAIKEITALAEAGTKLYISGGNPALRYKKLCTAQ